MKSIYDVVLRPVISEKADLQRDEDNIYCFEVHKDANKFEVKSAVEQMFKVDVTQIRTVVMRGKLKRVGKTFGKKRNWKKAYVTLKTGQTIELFERA